MSSLFKEKKLLLKVVSVVLLTFLNGLRKLTIVLENDLWLARTNLQERLFETKEEILIFIDRISLLQTFSD